MFTALNRVANSIGVSVPLSFAPCSKNVRLSR
jgi:hypothetical protein